MLYEGIIREIVKKSAAKLLLAGEVRGERALIERTIQSAVEAEMRAADELRAEADKLVEANMSQIRSTGADAGTLREQIFHKLARERGVIVK